MPPHESETALSTSDRRRQVASSLARGVIRWHRRAKAAGIIDAPGSSPGRETGLELPGETRGSRLMPPAGWIASVEQWFRPLPRR